MRVKLYNQGLVEISYMLNPPLGKLALPVPAMKQAITISTRASEGRYKGPNTNDDVWLRGCCDSILL